MDPNQTSYTYNGTTVEYTEAQKAIILADMNLIAQLKEKKNNIQNSYNVAESQVNEAKSHLDNDCPKLNNFPNKDKDKCMDYWNGIWNNARATQTQILTLEIPTVDQQIASATKKLNDDIATIQNDIKLQIQAQQSNVSAQTTVSTAPITAQAQAQAQIQALKNQAEKEKLESERKTKMFQFGVVAVVIIVIAVFALRST